MKFVESLNVSPYFYDKHQELMMSKQGPVKSTFDGDLERYKRKQEHAESNHKVVLGLLRKNRAELDQVDAAEKQLAEIKIKQGIFEKGIFETLPLIESLRNETKGLQLLMEGYFTLRKRIDQFVQTQAATAKDFAKALSPIVDLAASKPHLKVHLKVEPSLLSSTIKAIAAIAESK
jgi:hypothetical protein